MTHPLVLTALTPNAAGRAHVHCAAQVWATRGTTTTATTTTMGPLAAASGTCPRGSRGCWGPAAVRAGPPQWQQGRPQGGPATSSSSRRREVPQGPRAQVRVRVEEGQRPTWAARGARARRPPKGGTRSRNSAACCLRAWPARWCRARGVAASRSRAQVGLHVVCVVAGYGVFGGSGGGGVRLVLGDEG